MGVTAGALAPDAMVRTIAALRRFRAIADAMAVDRIDTLATEAAAELLGDLHRRFGSWELALGGYNMGYGGLVSIVTRLNSSGHGRFRSNERSPASTCPIGTRA